MTYQHGANYDRWRQLGKPKFEDIKIQVGMSMTKPFFMWVTEFFDGKARVRTGAIIAATSTTRRARAASSRKR